MDKATRDSGVEIMRIFLMLMICLTHSVGYTPDRWRMWLTNVSFVGVVGFVLISGYYGIKFRFSKIVRLEALGAVCALTVAVLSGDGLRTILASTLEIFRSYWFLHAYVLLMFIAPLIEDGRDRRKVVPILLVVFGWSFMTMLPGVQKFIPRTAGLDPYGAVVLLGVYAVGRIYRLHNWESWMNVSRAILLILIGLSVASIWYGFMARYNSPFLLMAALGVLYLFRRLTVNDILMKAVSIVSPSLFCIYLYHVTPLGYQLFESSERYLTTHGAPLYGVYFVNAFLAFLCGVVCDIPRRIGKYIVEPYLSRIDSAIDRGYERLVKE